MGKTSQILEIPIGDLVIGKGQIRTKAVGEGIDELAESIRIQGLLEPIIVCEAEKKGKYEVLAGQRRYLACKQLGLNTIEAILRTKKDETHAKVISATENMVRRDVSQREKIDVCTELYNKYNSIKDVCQATGLPATAVSQYVKFPRLIPQLQKLVKNDGLDLVVALRAQDAATAGADKTNVEEAVKLAMELQEMSGAQQRKVVKERIDDPEKSVEDVIESAKSGSKITQITVTLTSDVHKKLQSHAHNEGMTLDEAAALLIEEGLTSKGSGE